MRSSWAPSSSSCSFWPRVLELRITLIGISPPIWRLIQVPMNYVFFALHSAIQDAIGWESHCYRFEQFSRRPEIATIGLPLNGSVPSYDHDCLISPYFVDDGDTALYVVYRDNSQWEFQVVLEKSPGVILGVSYPKCVGGEGGSPPETIGDPEVFRTHLDIATDPANSSQNDFINTLSLVGYSDQFNPESVVFKNPRVRFYSLLEGAILITVL